MGMDAAATLREARARSGLEPAGPGPPGRHLARHPAGLRDRGQGPRVDTLDRLVRAAGFELDADLAARASRRTTGRPRPGAGRGAGAGGGVPGRARTGARVPRFGAVAGVTLPEKIVELHRARSPRAPCPHAFGGALALAWCTRRARGTDRRRRQRVRRRRPAPEVLAALPDGVAWGDDGPRPHRRATARCGCGGGRRRSTCSSAPRTSTTGSPAGPGSSLRSATSCPSSRAATWPSSRPSSTAPRTGPTSRRWPPPARSTSKRVLGMLVRYLGGDDHRVARVRSLA